MAPRKQDWTPRLRVVPERGVTLTYDRLPREWPDAIELINVLKQETDPDYLIREEGYDPRSAKEESDRMRSVVEAYERGEWYYIRAQAQTIINFSKDDETDSLVVTEGDVFSSDMPANALMPIEAGQLDELWDLCYERGLGIRKMVVCRLGLFWIQHPLPAMDECVQVDCAWRLAERRRS